MEFFFVTLSYLAAKHVHFCHIAPKLWDLPFLSLSYPSRLKIPLWLRWYRVCPQCRRPRFDSWVGKILWRRKWHTGFWPLPLIL